MITAACYFKSYTLCRLGGQSSYLNIKIIKSALEMTMFLYMWVLKSLAGHWLPLSLFHYAEDGDYVWPTCQVHRRGLESADRNSDLVYEGRGCSSVSPALCSLLQLIRLCPHREDKINYHHLVRAFSSWPGRWENAVRFEVGPTFWNTLYFSQRHSQGS